MPGLVRILVVGMLGVFSLLGGSSAGAEGFKEGTVTEILVEPGLYAAASAEILVGVFPWNEESDGIPSGSVQVVEGQKVLASGTLDRHGEASITIAQGFSGGRHELTAVYGGDLEWEESTSDPDSFDVSGYKLTSSLVSRETTAAGEGADGAAGEPISFTASFALRPDQPRPPAGVNPSGNVVFSDVCDGCGGPKRLGTVQIQNGKAVFSTSNLPAGSHQVSAAYQGDSRFEPVTAGPVAQRITAAGTSSVSGLVSGGSKSEPAVRAAGLPRGALRRTAGGAIVSRPAGHEAATFASVPDGLPAIELSGSPAGLEAAPAEVRGHDRVGAASPVKQLRFPGGVKVEAAAAVLLAAALLGALWLLLVRRLMPAPLASTQANSPECTVSKMGRSSSLR